MLAKIYLTVSMIVIAAVSSVSIASPVLAACDDAVMGFVPWYRGLVTNSGGSCQMKQIAGSASGPSTVTTNQFIWTIGLNIVQILLTAAAYVTIFFIMKGGFNYITSQGDSGKMTSAKQNVQNAVIGLVITLLSASIVNAIAGAIQ